MRTALDLPHPLLLVLLSVLSVVVIQSCASVSRHPVRNDPLIGKIIDTSTGRSVTFKTLMNTIIGHDIVFLSEKHDNADHHSIQRRIIQALISSDHPPAVGFEFFSLEETPLLMNFVDSAAAPHSPEMEAAIEGRMRSRLGWEGQKDTMWGYYWDLMVLARDNQLSMAGLDINASMKRRISRKGRENLTCMEKKMLFSTNFSDPVYEARMKEIFREVHCGMAGERMAERLFDTWVARNDQMAKSLSMLHDPEGKGPVVVIMGNGHTEYRLGVMERLKAITPKLSQINIGITEIARTVKPLDSYLTLLDLDGYPPVPSADYLWFTQRASYDDPCEKFRDRIKNSEKLDN